MPLPPGLYEALVTGREQALLDALNGLEIELAKVDDEQATLLLADHLRTVLVRALRGLPGEDRQTHQLLLANKLVTWLQAATAARTVEADDQVAPPTRVLRAVRDPSSSALGTGIVQRPLSLRHSDLLVNGPREPNVGYAITRELPSADSVDILVSFLKWSGYKAVERSLTEFLARRPGKLRVLTTTYMRATDQEVVEALRNLGAQILLSYDANTTRLHAKAWLFKRDSGFSTALVGSSNLSHAALKDGLEWNVRLTQVDNPTLLKKFQTTFDQYWGDGTFEAYDSDRFRQVTARRDRDKDALARLANISAYPHQDRALAALEAERSHGHSRNLVVAATGTGKTVVAALDYKRLCDQHGRRLTLLFVAHRREILEQSQAMYRAALNDGNFGERLVGKDKPIFGTQVFASVQSLHERRLNELDPDAYEVVVVDEFHHAAAKTYSALLDHLQPKVLLGLTATPERADGKSVLSWFGGRVATELRLWDALDQQLLAPFQYFGVHDGTDLSNVDFRAGRYDLASLESLYTADHIRAGIVLQSIRQHVRDPSQMRALGFCVSVRHAEFMAAFFNSKGLKARAVSGQSNDAERRAALQGLRAGTVQVVFAVDLFNEGVDVPDVDTVLFLRPTESATIFLQQLGRGLRRSDDKDCLTVLDFVGAAHSKFRFDRRFSALVGGTRAEVKTAVEEGFPFLPAGCFIQLDRESQAVILRNIRAGLEGARALAEDLKVVGDVGLTEFLRRADLEPEDLYRPNRCYTRLLHDAGLRAEAAPNHPLTKAFARLMHVDDSDRLDTWRDWLAQEQPPEADLENPLAMMLFAATGHVRQPVADMEEAFAEMWAQPDLRSELLELLGVLDDRRRNPTQPLPGLPFRLHATYSRDEVSAGLLQVRKGKLLRTQSGVFKDEGARCDVLFVTLNKDERFFTPTTLYEDYPISRELFHWESQGVTRAESATGKRYRNPPPGWQILLFVRKTKHVGGVTSPYRFLGPVSCESSEGEKPIKIVWRLEHPMPAAYWQEVKVAAG